jgi:hypothetical protein
MRTFKIILMAGFTIVTMANFVPQKAKAANPVASFGACYTLYNCQGGSIGSFEDSQCRSFGGHSINSGGLCLNL